MPFQVGDILASLGINTTRLKQQLAEAKAAVRKFAQDAGQAAGKANPFANLETGIKKVGDAARQAQTALNSLAQGAKQAASSAAAAVRSVGTGAGTAVQGQFSQAISAVRQQITQLSRTAGTAAQGLLNPQQIQRTAQLLGSTLRGGFNGVIGGLKLVGSAGAGAFKLISAGITSTINGFRSLFRTATSFKTLILGFATVRLFQRAGEFDNLQTAFDELSKSIGTLSQTFLPRLRNAVRGTVSDLELMRVTNNAILLGVAKTSDEFVKLAEAARRLGQATGRTTVQAFEDLALGIGRQSRLLLDNLGIIAKVDQSYAKYAVTIGKTSAQLTQVEQRFAFQQEVFRAIDERLATLGPDIETLGQAVQRLGATISNAFTDIAQSAISLGAVRSLASFLEANRPRIRAFISFVRESIDTIVNTVLTGFRRLRSGELSLAQIIDSMFGGAIRIINKTVVSLVENFAPVFLDAGFVMGKALIRGIIAGISGPIDDIGIAIRKRIEGLVAAPDLLPRERALLVARDEADAIKKAIDELKGTLSTEEISRLKRSASELENTLAGLFQESAKAGRAARDAVAQGIPVPDSTALGQRIDAAIEDLVVFRRRLETTIATPQLIEDTRAFTASAGRALDAFGEEVKGILGAVRTETINFIGAMTGDLRTAERAFDRPFDRARERLRDPIFGQRPINTDRLLQPLANVFNKAIQLREDFLVRFGKFIPDAVVKASAIPAQGAVNLFDRITTAISKFRAVLKPTEVDQQSFLEVFNQFRDVLTKLEFDELTAGATESSRAVAELDFAFRSMFKSLSREQIALVDSLRDSIRATASAADAAKAVAAFQEQLENLGRTEGETIAARIQKSLSEIQASEAIQIDVPRIQGQIGEIRRTIEAIKLSQIIRRDSPEVLAELDKLNDNLNSALSEVDLAGIQASLNQINPAKPFQDRLPDILVVLDRIKVDLARAIESREAVEKLEASLEKLTDAEVAIKLRLERQEFDEAIKKLQDELTFGLGPGQTIARDIDRRIAAIQKDQSLDSVQREIRINSLLRQREKALDTQGLLELQGLTKGLSTSVFGGIVEGFERGESAAKIWAGVVSDIFRQSMTRVIDQLTNQISNALGNLFRDLGFGLGAADLATGLIGIGSTILVGLRNRKDAQVQDFSQQINSSEAIRGVVAGPTNVAIAKVGDQLKNALRTTEILLTRIAVSVERGGGGGTGSGGQFFITRMTPSTPT
jgi:hypothetical protein